MKKVLAALAVLFSVAFSGAAFADAGRIERITVHGAHLEGNLEGNSADRTVFVYLPPSYNAQPQRRYPLVINLHGFTSTGEANVNYLEAPASVDRAIQNGAAEMIIVFPDAMTVHGGSMYSSSVTVGDWEAFIAEDLVAYMDANYRTLATRASRGLSGHSMGGYGTLRIGMKYPETFAALYAMSSCCLNPRLPSPTDARQEQVTTLEAARNLDFFGRAGMASSAAWSPNPNKPPFYFNMMTENGAPQPNVYADFAANALNALVHQYIPELKSFTAIGLEIGNQDFLIQDNIAMDALLTSYGVAHTYETYQGDHVNRVQQRFERHMLPFFTRHLATQ